MMESLGSGWLKSISSRDLMVRIMDWIDDVERFDGFVGLWILIDCYGYFRHQISRT
jgi:hypothetical protein